MSPDHQTTVISQVLPVMTSICTCHGIFSPLEDHQWFSHFKTSLLIPRGSLLCKMGICFEMLRGLVHRKSWPIQASHCAALPSSPRTLVSACPPVWLPLSAAHARTIRLAQLPKQLLPGYGPVPLTTSSLIEIGYPR